MADIKELYTEKGMGWYLKKKNISHVADNVLEAVAKLELQMEKDGVTYDDLARNRATEKVIELAQQAMKYQFVADNVIARTYDESNKNQEWEKLREELARDESRSAEVEKNSNAYKEAKERYAITGSHEDFERMVKAIGSDSDIELKGLSGTDEVNNEGFTAKDIDGMKNTHALLMEKYAKDYQAEKKDLSETIKELKSSASPQNRRLGIYLENKKIKDETLNSIPESEAVNEEVKSTEGK